MKQKLAKIVIKIVLLALVPVPSWAEIQLIAEPGQAADDFPPGFIYWKINSGSAVIGASGHVAFSGAADTSIRSTENNTNAVWAGLPGKLKTIIRENESPVGFPNNVLFDSPLEAGVGAAKSIVINRLGDVAFTANLKGAGQRQHALLVHVNGTTMGVIRNGDPAPGFPAGTFVLSIRDFSFSGAGMVITTSIGGNTTPPSTAIWFYDFENLTLLPPPGVGCDWFSIPATSINESSEIVLTTFLQNAGDEDCSVNTGDLPAGVFKWSNGAWETIMAEAEPVPGMLDANFTLLGIVGLLPTIPPILDEQGTVAFSANLASSGTIAPIRGGMWVKNGSKDLVPLVLTGETLAGNPNDIIANSFLNLLPFFNTGFTNGSAVVPVITTTGVAALLSGTPRNTQPYTNLNDTGESQLIVVAQQGEQPAGFDSTWFYSGFFGQAINRNGELFFVGGATDAINNDEVIAIWQVDETARPRLKAMPGMRLTVNGEERVLERIFGLGSNLRNTFMTTGGKGAMLSDNGDFIFGGSLSGSSNGVFLITDDSPSVTSPPALISDVDGNGQSDALTDGLLIIRFLFGLSGSVLTEGALGAGSSKSTTDIIAFLTANSAAMDVDGNGSSDALTDGILIIRFLFGLRGNVLISNAIGSGATRTTASEIENFLMNLL
ncbi:MAG TPA: hypothetical protein ENK06_03975 [Gammaproteobacteria bacterium]|nr:hypothetical protein [Gammaproteobacteria bacterium]